MACCTLLKSQRRATGEPRRNALMALGLSWNYAVVIIHVYGETLGFKQIARAPMVRRRQNLAST